MVQGVFPTEDMPGPYFAYTVGLLDRGCAAEVMMSGLPIELMHQILNEIAASMANGNGMPPATWELAGGYHMVPVFITHPAEPLWPGAARLYYGRDLIPMVQYVWPAEDHTYPWDETWPYEADAQPVGGTGRPLGA